MTKKKKKIDLSKLTKEQMEFIQAKVVRLGSLEAVERNYNREDAVSEFAMIYAIAYYQK